MILRTKTKMINKSSKATKLLDDLQKRMAETENKISKINRIIELIAEMIAKELTKTERKKNDNN